MHIPRAAFLISVHDLGQPVVLENLRTRERKRIDELGEIPTQIERWLAAELQGAEAPDPSTLADLR
jgi:hypothetical protein